MFQSHYNYTVFIPSTTRKPLFKVPGELQKGARALFAVVELWSCHSGYRLPIILSL